MAFPPKFAGIRSAFPASRILALDLVFQDPDFFNFEFDGVTVFQRGFTGGDLWDKLLGTLEHMAYGWFIASIAGIALGAMVSYASVTSPAQNCCFFAVASTS